MNRILQIGSIYGCKILLEGSEDNNVYITASILQKILHNGLQMQMINTDRRFKDGEEVTVMEFELCEKDLRKDEDDE
jgi:hypothetical protein